MKAKLILIGAIAVITLGVFAYIQQGKAENSVTTTEDAKAQQIAELEAIMNANPNKDSQEYQQVRQEWCALRSRPAAEREKAAANVRKLLGMTDVHVEFTCGRGDSEYYTAAGWMLTVDPKTDYIMAMNEAERRWGTNEDGTRWFDPIPEYDNTPRYTTPEAIKPVVEAFMRKHQDILGVDIDELTYEYRGTKPGNWFVAWNGGRRIDITITQGGQVVVYQNDSE